MPHSRFRPKKRVSSSACRVPSDAWCGNRRWTRSLVPTVVVRQLVRLQVLPHVAIGPVGDGADFVALTALLHDWRLRAAAGLAAAQAGEPGAHVEFVQGAAHRFDLAQVVVLIDADHALFPQAAVARFHPGAADQRAIYLEIELEPFGQGIGEAVGFREQVAGVDQDHRDVRALLAEQMQRHCRLRAEAGRQRRVLRAVLQRPGHAFVGMQAFQLRIERVQIVQRGRGDRCGR